MVVCWWSPVLKPQPWSCLGADPCLLSPSLHLLQRLTHPWGQLGHWVCCGGCGGHPVPQLPACLQARRAGSGNAGVCVLPQTTETQGELVGWEWGYGGAWSLLRALSSPQADLSHSPRPRASSMFVLVAALLLDRLLSLEQSQGRI